MDELLLKWNAVIYSKGKVNRISNIKNIYEKLNYVINCNRINNCQYFNLRQELDVFIDIMTSVPSKKCKEKSELLKKQGIEMYVSKKTMDALNIFNKALRYVPAGEGIIPLLYGNRSAALFRLKMYSECVADISRALCFHCPELKPKLLIRKIRCHIELGERSKATEELKYLHNNFESQIIKKYNKDIIYLEDEVKNILEIKKVSDVGGIPLLYGGKSDMVPQMSSALEIRENKKYGRHIVAKELIKTGSVLLVEEAFASISIPTNLHTRCNTCLNNTWNPIMCEKCTDVVWCTEKCRDINMRSHNYECTLLSVLINMGLGTLSFRIVTEAGWDTCMKDDDKSTTANKFSFKNGYDGFQSLLSHFEDCTEADQLLYCQIAHIIAKLLVHKTDFVPVQERKKTKTIIKLSAILAECITRLACNACAISELHHDLDSVHFIYNLTDNKVASGLFTLTSLMNHSCKSSVLKTFHGKTLVLRAIKDLPADSQVYISYGPCLGIRKDRRDYLKKYYFFDCDCTACEDKEAEFKDANWFGIKCPTCNGVAQWSDEKFSSVECLSCKMMFKPPPSKLLLNCEKVNALYNEGLDLLLQRKFTSAEVKLSKALEKGAETYSDQNMFLYQIRSDYIKALIWNENYTSLSNEFQKCVKFAELKFDKYSYQYCIYILGFLSLIEIYTKGNSALHPIFAKIVKGVDEVLTVSYGNNWRKDINYSKLSITNR